MPVSGKGRVEQQKRNQTATFPLPFGFVFGVKLDYSSRLKVPLLLYYVICGWPLSEKSPTMTLVVVFDYEVPKLFRLINLQVSVPNNIDKIYIGLSK